MAKRLNAAVLKKGYAHALLLILLSHTYACGTILAPKYQPIQQEMPQSATDFEQQVMPVRPKIALTDEVLYKILLAEFAGQRGMFAVAIAHYLDLARLTRDPKVVARATRIAFYAKDQKAALQASELWFELDPNNLELRQILATLSIKSDAPEQALLHLDFIIKNSSGELDQKLWMIANFLSQNNDPELVIATIEQLMQNYMDNADALYTFAQIAARLGKIEKAKDVLEMGLQIKPENEQLALAYVSLLLQNQKNTAAIHWIEGKLKQGKEDNSALRYTYARLLAQSQPEKALQQLEILVKKTPDDAKVLHMLALLYLQKNQLDLAKKYLLRLTDSFELEDEAYYYLGHIAEMQGKLEDASNWYKKIVQDQYYFKAHIRLSFIIAKQDNIEQGLQYIHTIQPRTNEEKLMHIQAQAEMLAEEARYQQAITLLSTAIKKNSHTDLLFARAMLAEKMDRLDILEQDLRAILQDSPNDAQALNALGYTLADKTSRYDEAYTLIKKALQLTPDSFYVLDSMGWVLYKLGSLDEAAKYLSKALKLHADPEIAAHLGEVLWVMGRRQQARDVWYTALKNTPKNDYLLETIQRFSP